MRREIEENGIVLIPATNCWHSWEFWYNIKNPSLGKRMIVLVLLLRLLANLRQCSCLCSCRNVIELCSECISIMSSYDYNHRLLCSFFQSSFQCSLLTCQTRVPHQITILNNWSNNVFCTQELVSPAVNRNVLKI